jgi:hypothetical protein
MGIDLGQTLCTQLSGTHRAKRTFASLRRWKLSNGDLRAKRMQGDMAFDVAELTKQTREHARTLKQSAKREQSFQCILHKVHCSGASSHRHVPCPRATTKRATRRDSYYEACCLRIGQANRSRPREKAQLQVTPRGFGIEGKSEINERETSGENDNKIQIHAPQSGILAVGFLRRRHCNFHRRMRGRSVRNSV